MKRTTLLTLRLCLSLSVLVSAAMLYGKSSNRGSKAQQTVGDVLNEHGRPCLVSYVHVSTNETRVDLIYPQLIISTPRLPSSKYAALVPYVPIEAQEFHSPYVDCKLPTQMSGGSDVSDWRGFTKLW